MHKATARGRPQPSSSRSSISRWHSRQRRPQPRLAELRASIEEELCRLRLEIHPGKSRIFPGRTRLVRGNVVRFRRRMRSLAAEYVAHTAHGDTWKLRQQIFGQFENGHFVPTSWRTL